ncbi:uncharacterized protein OCT59_007695 [Rhizophagus irregularis]|uniref:uncharacterized protein n=1 Tax=Rhizophagus irregularis TaxID=588596 RepID=UPI0033245866|nr:hypothetical protein OCT59_007695 [Rhizophagus irregularis]
MNVRNSTFRRFGWAAPWRRNSIFRRFGFFGRLLGFLDGRKSIRHFEGSTSLGGSLLDISKTDEIKFDISKIYFKYTSKYLFSFFNETNGSSGKLRNGKPRMVQVFRPCEIRNDGSSVRLGVSKRYSLDIGFRLPSTFIPDWDAKA